MTPATAPEAPISPVVELGSLKHEGNAGADAAGQIEGEEAPMPERLLDVVAEHKQENHVAENVHEIGMQELLGDERERLPAARPDGAGAGQRRRNQSRQLIELVHLVGPAKRPAMKNTDEVDDDQEPTSRKAASAT